MTQQTEIYMEPAKLQDKIKALLNSSNTSISKKLTQICEMLKDQIPHYDWVGFYFSQPETQTLHLKAFAGKPTDHTVIPYGKGICGQVAVSNNNFIVPDVSVQDNYIACSIDVKSEIVIPLFKNGQNIGQIDIDSHTPNAFSKKDEEFLTWLNTEVSKIL